MIEGKGWFAFYFSGLCEGKNPKELEEAVHKTCMGAPAYSFRDFVQDLEALLWAGFDGAVHPVLGKIHIHRSIPPGQPNIWEWEIACPLGRAEFTREVKT